MDKNLSDKIFDKKKLRQKNLVGVFLCCNHDGTFADKKTSFKGLIKKSKAFCD